MELPSLESLPFNIVDAALVAIVALSLWRGWRRGFVVGVVELACLAGSLLAAFFAAPLLGNTLDNNRLLMEPWASPAAFLLVFIVAQIAIGSLARLVVRPIYPGTTARKVDRFLGILPGAANGVINAMVVAVLLTALPLTDAITKASQDSEGIAKLGVPAEWLE
ncbi:MAG: hypothetical protein JWQ41_347, partial [Variovorax sp.]|nr:hypothetical protein [Variovorax sp.]